LRAARPLLLALAALLIAAAPASSERVQEGDLLGSFNADLRPGALPRTELAPVAVRVAGDFWTTSGNLDDLPQLRRITVGINRQGRLFDRGLPTCRIGQIQPSNEREAQRKCGDAIVGSGHVRLQVRIPGQLPFLVRAKLLAFNGPHRDGRKLILAQAYAHNPPGSFVLTFQVRQKPGLFGTVLSTTLPADAREWAYLTHFDMTLNRRYEYRGQSLAYVSAACGAPAGFDSALFPFARATYAFATGETLSLSVARTCRVAG
jgi:hypothetical protein